MIFDLNLVYLLVKPKSFVYELTVKFKTYWDILLEPWKP